MEKDSTIVPFIETLRGIGLDMDACEIADILWLAPFLEGHSSSDKPPRPRSENKTKGSREGGDITPEVHGQAAAKPLQIPESASCDSKDMVAGMAFQAPATGALPGKLAISQSLRPLKRKVPSRSKRVLDEAATARRIAEMDNWLPVMRPEPSRWLDLVLLVDRWPSMVVWQQTIAEWKDLLECQGAFRNIRVWELHTETAKDGENEGVRLQVQSCPGVSTPPRNPLELVDPAGERLILIASDCVSPAWRDGRMARLMEKWGDKAMFAVVQMFPSRHWSRTGLGKAETVSMRSPGPGIPNAYLDYELEDEWFEESASDASSDIRFPVITLEPEFLYAWAKFLTGGANMRIPGALLSKHPEWTEEEDAAETPKQLDPEKRVQRFHAAASPYARLLAGYLSSVPLNLPVMRLVQKKMLPQSSQVHLAEVFLSGLIERISFPADAKNQESIRYDFVPDVREHLRKAALTSETLKVTDLVSEFIEKNQGMFKEFLAAIPVASIDGLKMIREGSLSFASIRNSLLRRMGGAYVKLADFSDEGAISEQDYSSGDIRDGKRETESSGVHPGHETVDPRALLNEIETCFWPMLNEKRLDCKVEVDPAIPKALILNEAWLLQILLKIVGKAVKYTEKGFIRMSIGTLRFDEERGKIDLLIEVEDSGIGIPTEELDLISEFAFKGRGQEKVPLFVVRGMGPTSREMIRETMNDVIIVDSEPGKGSFFLIVLRGVEINSTVLVVEDNVDQRKIYKWYFKKYTTLKTIVAETGERAVFMAKKYMPDIIFMYLEMPGMNGYEAIRQIKEDPRLKHIPVFAITAWPLNYEISKIKEHGFNEGLEKPMPLEELHRILCKYLRHSVKKEHEICREAVSEKALPHIFEVVNVLERDYMPRWKNFMKKEPVRGVAELAVFGSKLKELGESSVIPRLEKYGNDIVALTQSFDIVNLKKKAAEFPELIKQLRSSGRLIPIESRTP